MPSLEVVAVGNFAAYQAENKKLATGCSGFEAFKISSVRLYDGEEVRTAHAEAGLVHVREVGGQQLFELRDGGAQRFGVLLGHYDGQGQRLSPQGLRHQSKGTVAQNFDTSTGL